MVGNLTQEGMNTPAPVTESESEGGSQDLHDLREVPEKREEFLARMLGEK